jgi:N utilization substance protein B
MQSLYALKQSEASSFHHAHESFKEIFAPDLNSMEVQDPVLLESKRKQADHAFDANFLSDEITFTDETPEIKKVVTDALKRYKESISKEKKFFRNLMIDTTGKLFETYIYTLLFPLDLQAYISSGEESKIVTKLFGAPEFEILPANSLLHLLKENKKIQEWQIRRSMRWEKEVLKKVLVDADGADEEYRKQISGKAEGFPEQKEQVLYLFKKIVFKNESVHQYFEDSEINWAENRSVIKSMVLKTIKSIEEGAADIEVLELSSNWEEDKEFFIELYNKSVANDLYLEDIISKKTKHWDIERVAAIDKIILKMALSEMIDFPSIPVKVSINEYIELSKVYSTPKSKQFINGILDKISADLVQEGVIKKSGRGLIDNK